MIPTVTKYETLKQAYHFIRDKQPSDSLELQDHVKNISDIIIKTIPKIQYAVYSRLNNTVTKRQHYNYTTEPFCFCCNDFSKPKELAKGQRVVKTVSICRVIMEEDVIEFISQNFSLTKPNEPYNSIYLKILETFWKDLVHSMQFQLHNSISPGCKVLAPKLDIIPFVYHVCDEDLQKQQSGEIPYSSYVSVTMEMILFIEKLV